METIKEDIVWHMCKQDGLPPIDKKVLVCCVNKKGEPFVHIGKRDEKRWVVSGTVRGVYAWAELPSSPASSYAASPCIECTDARWSLDLGHYICKWTHEHVKPRDATLCEYFSERPVYDPEEDTE